MFIKKFYIAYLPILLILSIVLSASHAVASGFFNQEQSISGFGRANAGQSAYSTDSSVIFFNPAGMVFLDKAQGYNGSHALHPRYDFDDQGSTLLGAPVGGDAGSNPFGIESIPNIYFATPVGDQDLWLGLGITFPFGLSSRFDSDWFGRYDAIKSELITVDIQPSVAMRVNDWLSVGGGIDFQYVESELTNAVFDTREGLSRLQGKDWTTGYNIGLIVEPTPKLNLGVHYRSSIRHEVSGSVLVEGTDSSNFYSKATANLDLPDVVSLGAAYDIRDDWKLLGHINWFGWGKFEDLTVVSDTGDLLQRDLQNFNNSYSFAIGVENQFNDDWVLRSGIQYSQTPTNIGTRSSRIPDSNRTWVATGASYKLTDKWTLDLALSYTFFKDVNLSVSRNSGTANFNASRSGDSVNAAVGIKFDF